MGYGLLLRDDGVSKPVMDTGTGPPPPPPLPPWLILSAGAPAQWHPRKVALSERQGWRGRVSINLSRLAEPCGPCHVLLRIRVVDSYRSMSKQPNFSRLALDLLLLDMLPVGEG